MSDATYSADGRHALLRSAQPPGSATLGCADVEAIEPAASYSRESPGWLIAPRARFIASWDSGGVASWIRPRFRCDSTSPLARATTTSAIPHGTPVRTGAGSRSATNRAQSCWSIQSPVRDDACCPARPAWVHWLQFNRDGGGWSPAAKTAASGSGDSGGWLHPWPTASMSGTPVWSVAADPDTGLVRIGGTDAVSVWQVSGLGEADRAAQPRAPLFRQPIPRYASDLHAASGLLATASDDGEVRLWRLPATPMRARTAAPQMTSQLMFDGEHLVAVEAAKPSSCEPQTGVRCRRRSCIRNRSVSPRSAPTATPW